MSANHLAKLQEKLKTSTAATTDPRIAALQSKYSSILNPQVASADETAESEQEDEYGDLVEYDEDTEDFHNDTGFDDDFDEYDDEDDQDEDDNESVAALDPFADINDEVIGDEDDEVNVFEYDWDIERNESDSELDGNDDEEDNPEPDSAVVNSTKKMRKLDDDSTRATSTLSHYDQFFNTPLSSYQITQLEYASPFLPPKSGTVGMILKDISSASDNAMVNVLKQNKLNPLNSPNSDPSTSMTRVFTPVINAVPHAGGMLDPINASKIPKKSTDQKVHIENTHQMTSAQFGISNFQVSSDRVSMGLSPLPTFPQSDTQFLIDDDGNPLVYTALPPKKTDKSNKKTMLAKLVAMKKDKAAPIKESTTTQLPHRNVQSFSSLSLKQRLWKHLEDSSLLTSTTYNAVRDAYMGYISQPQYEFLGGLQEQAYDGLVLDINQQNKAATPSFQNDSQSLLSSILSTYTDVLMVPNTHPPFKNVEWVIYRDVYLIHIINHVLTHRDRIIAHNEALYRRDARHKETAFIKALGRLSDPDARWKALEERCNELYNILDDDTKSAFERQEAQARLAVLTHSNKTRMQIKQFEQQHKDAKKAEQANKKVPRSNETSKALRTLGSAPSQSQNTQTELKYRDQGYTRPTALVLLPTRAHAYTTITRLLQLLPPQQTKKIVNMERLHEEYGDVEGDYNPHPAKSLDYQLTFQGNSDDCFRIGLQLNGSGVKLFSSLYSSDIIFASPLGLKLIVGNEGSEPHERRADFLSSIEILTIDNLDLIAQQNVDHLIDVLQSINGFPTKTSSVDFGRVKDYFLRGHARFYRHNIWLSSTLTPHLQHLYGIYCENKNGRLRLRPATYPGVQPYFTHPKGTIRQIMYRLDLSSTIASQTASLVQSNTKKTLDTVYEKKLNIWFSDIWPRIKDWYQHEGNTVIFVPSSHDFVRIRNIMKQKFVDYCICSEYTDQRLVDSYRTRIKNGSAKFILVSERFWIFNRALLQGIKHVIWYGVPTQPEAYIDFINFIKPSMNTQATNQQTSLVSSNVTLKTGSFAGLAKKQPTSFLLYSVHDAMALERIVGTEFAREILLSGDNMHIVQ